MDDYELDRIASNNPALTAPAAQRAPINRHKSHDRKKFSTNESNSSQDTVTPADLTKYDVSKFTSQFKRKSNDVSRLAGVESCETSRLPGSA
jgi:hypothetical protein